MSEITYQSTKAEIWSHCKDLRASLIEAHEGPHEAEALPATGTRQDAEPLAALRAKVECALESFQQAQVAAGQQRTTLAVVHGIDFEGPSTLADLCSHHVHTMDTQKELEMELQEANRDLVTSNADALREFLAEAGAAMTEERRLSMLAYGRDTAEKADVASRERRRLTEELHDSAVASSAKLEAVLQKANDAGLAKEAAMTSVEIRVQTLLAKAAKVPLTMEKAQAGATAQGRAIGAKQVSGAKKLLDATRASERVLVERDIESLSHQATEAVNRAEVLRTNIRRAQGAAIALASQSVTSKSDAGALAAVSEIALKQAAAPAKSK